MDPTVGVGVKVKVEPTGYVPDTDVHEVPQLNPSAAEVVMLPIPVLDTVNVAVG